MTFALGKEGEETKNGSRRPQRDAFAGIMGGVNATAVDPHLPLLVDSKKNYFTGLQRIQQINLSVWKSTTEFNEDEITEHYRSMIRLHRKYSEIFLYNF